MGVVTFKMSKYFTPKRVMAAFNVTLAPRYEQFLTKKEWQKYDGRFADVPSYQKPLQVHLTGQQLESFFHDEWPEDEPDYGHPSATEVDLGGKEGWVPLATLGDEEPQFLVVNVNETKCPVAMWEHESARFVACAQTLDAFLASLEKTKDSVTPAQSQGANVAALSRITEKSIGLPDGRLTKARLQEIEKALAALEPLTKNLPSEMALTGGEYHGLPSRAVSVQAKMLRALKRFDAACDTLENAVIDGEKKTGIAPAMLCEMLLHDLDQPKRVIAVCEAQAEIRPVQLKMWALALFREGQLDEAAKHWSTAIECQVSATLKLYPKKERTKELKECLKDTAERVNAYAEKHDLDAKKLLGRINVK